MVTKQYLGPIVAMPLMYVCVYVPYVTYIHAYISTYSVVYTLLSPQTPTYARYEWIRDSLAGN